MCGHHGSGKVINIHNKSCTHATVRAALGVVIHFVLFIAELGSTTGQFLFLCVFCFFQHCSVERGNLVLQAVEMEASTERCR